MIIKGKNLKVIDSFELSEYITYKVGKASHLKIQKLLYYIQGFHLGYFDSEIITDKFQAWLHGPVSRKLFDELKDKSTLHKELSYIQRESEEHIKDRIAYKLLNEQIELVDEVIEAYGSLSGIELESLTHRESPWINARRGYSEYDKCENEISNSDLLAFFKTKIYA